MLKLTLMFLMMIMMMIVGIRDEGWRKMVIRAWIVDILFADNAKTKTKKGKIEFNVFRMLGGGRRRIGIFLW